MKKLKEKDLRKVFAKAFKGSIVFVEHGRGGTVGVSDCILFYDDKTYGITHIVFIELKRDRKSHIRLSQKKFARLVLNNKSTMLIACWEDVNDNNSKIRFFVPGLSKRRALYYSHTLVSDNSKESLEKAIGRLIFLPGKTNLKKLNKI